MSLTDREVEIGAAALFAFGFPVDPMRAWNFLSDDYKPPYREKARAVLRTYTGETNVDGAR